MDEAYAKTTPFRARIAHGALIASFVSALMASEVPGPGGIYISQTANFKRPVKIGDEVTTKVSIAALDPVKSYATIAFECAVGERVVMDGEALVIVPRKRRARAVPTTAPRRRRFGARRLRSAISTACIAAIRWLSGWPQKRPRRAA
jgi:3-hydroxybutyryl-CoA dehydratase